MIILFAAVAAFALLMGTVSFVTTPVALAVAAVVGTWLVLFAARERISRRLAGRRAQR